MADTGGLIFKIGLHLICTMSRTNVKCQSLDMKWKVIFIFIFFHCKLDWMLTNCISLIHWLRPCPPRVFLEELKFEITYLFQRRINIGDQFDYVYRHKNWKIQKSKFNPLVKYKIKGNVYFLYLHTWCAGVYHLYLNWWWY